MPKKGGCLARTVVALHGFVGFVIKRRYPFVYADHTTEASYYLALIPSDWGAGDQQIHAATTATSPFNPAPEYASGRLSVDFTKGLVAALPKMGGHSRKWSVTGGSNPCYQLGRLRSYQLDE